MQNNFFSKSIIVDVLEKPNKNSNVSSQIIYGEKFKILSKNQNFYKVKNLNQRIKLKLLKHKFILAMLKEKRNYQINIYLLEVSYK